LNPPTEPFIHLAMQYGVCVFLLLLGSCALNSADQAECGIAEDCEGGAFSMLQKSMVAAVETEAGWFGRGVVADRCSGSQELLPLALPGELETTLDHSLALDKPRAPDAEKKRLHEIRAAEAKSIDSNSNPLSLIFYGDSITEMLREENHGVSLDPEELDPTMVALCCIINYTGFKRMFYDEFVSPFGQSAVMAVAGDTSADLLWRMQNGENFSKTADAVMLHIGINDINFNLGGATYLNPCQLTANVGLHARPRTEFGDADADNVYFGIKAVVQQILSGCQAPVVLTGLFPTGMEWPDGPYGAVIPRVNSLLQKLAAASSGRLHFIDCSWAVLNNETGKIDTQLMPDYLHPSLAGGARWADCMSQALECKVFKSRTC